MSLLTRKQLKFIDEYLVDENGARAAIRAGYSRKTARSIASENLKKPKIAMTIERYRLEASDKAGGGRSKIVHILATLAFRDIRGIFHDDGSLKHPRVWPKRILEQIEQNHPKRARGSKKDRRRVASLDADAERLRVLGKLAKYLSAQGLLDS
jgi:phage terminase small subunit